MRKQIYLFILVLFLIPFVSAYLPHQVNTDLDLIVQSNNGTSCNITSIQYPSGSATFVSLIMNRTAQSFNYTLDAGNFSSLGNICFDLVCNDGSGNEVGSVCREITPTGVRIISIGVPSSKNGMSSAGTILEITPLFPCRPAILSPT